MVYKILIKYFDKDAANEIQKKSPKPYIVVISKNSKVF